jgi:hypothetical protein
MLQAFVGEDARCLWLCWLRMTGNLTLLRVANAVACTLKDNIFPDVCASDIERSSYVDMYNATSNSWTTYPTGLGQARSNLAAASLASGLVFFVGGLTGESPLSGQLFVLIRVMYAVVFVMCVGAAV